MAELPEMIGEFEKAKFFSYNPDICAHGNSKLTGCTRCLEVCPTGAITSLIDKIAVDPYYCQGGGSCATACPSGAIVYSYPRPADMINRLRVLLRDYYAADGQQPQLLFHDSEAGNVWLSEQTAELPGNVLPVEVEEIGSVGLDIWFSALAFGASRVLLLDTPQVPERIRSELDNQINYADAILQGMGYPDAVIRRVMADQSIDFDNADWPAMPPITSAGFAGSNEKRNALFFAVDSLYRQAPQPQAIVALPERAPFGEIQVNRDTCTLCMACVSVCPASALADGGDKPQLNFVEANCVQCGLCELACPEQAIQRQPRFVYDAAQRRQTRLLNEEAPFLCVSCGKAFATRSVIDKMLGKLAGHSMFQEPDALRRLQMCGDCRVKDMFAADLDS